MIYIFASSTDFQSVSVRSRISQDAVNFKHPIEILDWFLFD